MLVYLERDSDGLLGENIVIRKVSMGDGNNVVSATVMTDILPPESSPIYIEGFCGILY